MSINYFQKPIVFILTLLLSIVSGYAQNMVNYAGGTGKERFYSVVMLSNKTLLVSGTAQDLDWLPAGVNKVQFEIDSIRSSSVGKIGFIMQLSANMKSLLNVCYFPIATVRDIYKIETTNIPGSTTGDIYISGNRDVTNLKDDGYFIAKLNNNFVNGVPNKLLWSYNVLAPDGDHKTIQPWDVGSDGKVVFVTGKPIDPNWASVERLTSDGKRDLVPNWPAHWSKANKEYDSTAISYNNGSDPLVYSAVVMKAGRNGSLRSKSVADYSAIITDGNGSTKQGMFPDDYYYKGPCNSKVNNGGPGYTGYKTTSNSTQRVGAVTIDRNTNDIYFGYGTQTTLPNGGLPDFEPAVVAMDKNGNMKWWSRLYKETANNSTPDQYVDGLTFDHSRNIVVVLARCHGNNTDNLWSGNAIASNKAASGFQNGFTGTNGNIHISWLGKFNGNNGTLLNSTYIAEFNEGPNNYGPALTNPNMNNWPNPNAGWPNVNTTRCANKLVVGNDGSITILAAGRRTMTTKNAYQKMPLPTYPAKGTWNYFIRTYSADLSRPLYSSLLTGNWDTLTGSGGSNIDLFGVCKTDSGLVAVGYHKTKTADVATGNPMPTKNVPSWGNSEPVNEQAVFAKLVVDSLRSNVATNLTTKNNLAKNEFVIFPNPASQNVMINYTLQENAQVKISVCNLLGKVFIELSNSTQPIGEYQQNIDTHDFQSGVYFMTLYIGNQQFVQKLIINK